MECILLFNQHRFSHLSLFFPVFTCSVIPFLYSVCTNFVLAISIKFENVYCISLLNSHTPKLIARKIYNGETYCFFGAKLQRTCFNASLGFCVRQLLQLSKNSTLASHWSTRLITASITTVYGHFTCLCNDCLVAMSRW